jgi:hypothetical protein
MPKPGKFFCAPLLLLTALTFPAAAFAQSPLYIRPHETWMQEITLLGNEDGRDINCHNFSAVEESTYVHKPDEHTTELRTSWTTCFYCDRYGRTRAERHVTSYRDGEVNQTWLAGIYIADPIGGFLYRLDPANHKATRSAWDHESRAAAFDRDHDRDHETTDAHSTALVQAVESQVKTEYLGVSKREELTVDGWRQTLTVPAATVGNESDFTIKVESFISRELKLTVYSRREVVKEVGKTVRETWLTKINRSEPENTLFQVPADYKIEDAPDADHFAGGENVAP